MKTVYTLQSFIFFPEDADDNGTVEVFGTLQAARDAGAERIKQMIANNNGLFDEDDSVEDVLEDWYNDQRMAGNWESMPLYIEFVVEHGHGEAVVSVHKHDVSETEWVVHLYSAEADEDGAMHWYLVRDYAVDQNNIPLTEAGAQWMLQAYGPQGGDTILGNRSNSTEVRYIVYQSGFYKRLILMAKSQYPLDQYIMPNPN